MNVNQNSIGIKINKKVFLYIKNIPQAILFVLYSLCNFSWYFLFLLIVCLISPCCWQAKLAQSVRQNRLCWINSKVIISHPMVYKEHTVDIFSFFICFELFFWGDFFLRCSALKIAFDSSTISWVSLPARGLLPHGFFIRPWTSLMKLSH